MSKKKRIKIDYSKLRIGDMVVCGGKGITANIIRRATVGWRKARDKSISVHTGIVAEFGGQKFIIEMLGKGIALSSFLRYENNIDRRFIIDIRRSAVYDSEEKREALQARMALDYRHQIEYDWAGDVNFVISKIKDKPKKFYCSEYYHHVTKQDGCYYPDTFDTRVSPYDLQVCYGFSSLNGWKIA